MPFATRSGALTLAVFAAAALAGGCASLTRGPAACDVLAIDEIATVVNVTAIRRDDSSSGFNTKTRIDSCRWTASGGTTVELRLYRADAEDAWAMVFESAKAHATTPDAAGRVRGRTLSGVGDDAMILPGSAGEESVAFKVGRTGATLAGRAPEAALVELAKRVAGRL